MFRLFCCACFALVCSVASAQECDPRGGVDLHITSDVLVDRNFNWFCDTYVEDGVQLTIVDGGHVSGMPIFMGQSALLMSGGYLQSMRNDNEMLVDISGGQTNSISVGSELHVGTLSGGVHNTVNAVNAVISGGTMNRLDIGYRPVSFVGGEAELASNEGPAERLLIDGGIIHQLSGNAELSGGQLDGSWYGYLFWSGGALLDAWKPEAVVFVMGSDLSMVDGHLTGVLDDGSVIDQIFTSGTFILSEHGLVAGDLDRDGVVGLSDLNAIRNNFGQGGPSAWDVNFDGVADLTDLNIVRNNFGATAANPVPEPSTIAMLLIGLSVLGNCCHRSKRPASGKGSGRRADPAR